MTQQKPEAEEVTVRRTEIMVPTAEGPAQAMIYVTYTVVGQPPRTIYLEKLKPSEEEVRKTIQEDMAKRPVPTVHRAVI